MSELDDDTRTPEQHMADVAEATLERLCRVCDELHSLSDQFTMLGRYAHETDTELGHQLLALAEMAQILGSAQAGGEIRSLRNRLPRRIWIPARPEL